MAADPALLASTSMNLWVDYMRLWQSTLDEDAGHCRRRRSPSRRRATGASRTRTGRANFLFDYIKQSYLIAAPAHPAGRGARSRACRRSREKKVAFFTRQYVDALAPSNFLMTNPQVLRETVRSGGQNLVRGLNNLLADIEKGGGQLRISMTDEKAFQLGGNVATTPGKVVFQNDADAAHPVPADDAARCYKRPLVIIPPWINKYYILDLREKNSFIRWAVAQGHTVFVVSWVNPDASLAQKGFDDYMLEGPLAALDAIEKATGERELNVIGYCLGGTLLGATLGYLSSKEAGSRSERHLLRQPARFLGAGRARGVHRRGAGRQPREEDERARLSRRLRDGGHVQPAARERPGLVVRRQQLPARQGPVPVRPAVLERGLDAHAGAHAQLLPAQHVHQEPARRAGRHQLAGVPIDLAKVQHAALLHLHGRGPHRAVEDDVQGRDATSAAAVRFVLGGSGHIAGIVNPPAAKKYHYWTNDALPDDRRTSGSPGAKQTPGLVVGRLAGAGSSS